MQYHNLLSRSLVLLTLTAFLGTVQAAEKVLCYVSSDVDKDTGRMVYEMDEDGRAIKHLYKEAYVNGKLTDRQEVNMADLLGAGIILHQKDKYVTVRLYSHNFDEERGGVLYLDTLSNAIKGERKEYTIEVSKDLNSDLVMSSAGKTFNNMKFIGKRAPIVGVIGIDKVNFSQTVK